MVEEKGQFDLLSVKLVLYIVFAVLVSMVMSFVAIPGLSLLVEHFTHPSSAYMAVGFPHETGIGHLIMLFMRLCDHVLIILLISVSMSVVISIGLNALNLIPDEKYHLYVYIAYTILLLFGVGYLLFDLRLFPAEMTTKIDVIISLCLILFFSLFFFMENGSPSKKENLKTCWGIILSCVVCFLILLVSFGLAVLFNYIFQFLNIFNYLDMFFGEKSHWLHVVSQIFCHILGIIIWLMFIAPYYHFSSIVLNKFVPVKKTAYFLFSAVTLWGLVFLLYLVTQHTEMADAIIDKYDFCVVVAVFAFIPIYALSDYVIKKKGNDN